MTGRQAGATRRGGAFDALQLSARGQALTGAVDAGALERVADRLAEGPAPIEWRIAGAGDALGRPALEVRVDGTVPLECQRCLRSFPWSVAQRTLLLLARDERELARLDASDEHETILAAAPLSAQALVEDELLLTLPFAPHCDRADCTTAAASDGSEAGAESRAARSPFRALAQLKAGPAGKPKA